MRHGLGQICFYGIGGQSQSGSVDARYMEEFGKCRVRNFHRCQCIAAFHDKGQTRVADSRFVWLASGPAKCLSSFIVMPFADLRLSGYVNRDGISTFLDLIISTISEHIHLLVPVQIILVPPHMSQ